MLRRAAAFLIVCVAVAALLYGAALAWSTFTSHPFTIGGLPPLPFPSIQPPGGGPGSGSPPPLPGQGPPGAPTPVAATQQPQPSSKSCPGLTLTSFKLTTKAVRQETVTWSSSGGCAPYGGLISWSGQGIQSGQAPVTTPSGTTVVTVSGPPCPPPPNNTAQSTVTFKIVLGDAAGHRGQSAVVAVVALC